MCEIIDVRDWSVKKISTELVRNLKRIGIDEDLTIPQVLDRCYSSYLEMYFEEVDSNE